MDILWSKKSDHAVWASGDSFPISLSKDLLMTISSSSKYGLEPIKNKINVRCYNSHWVGPSDIITAVLKYIKSLTK